MVQLSQSQDDEIGDGSHQGLSFSVELFLSKQSISLTKESTPSGLLTGLSLLPNVPSKTWRKLLMSLKLTLPTQTTLYALLRPPLAPRSSTSVMTKWLELLWMLSWRLLIWKPKMSILS